MKRVGALARAVLTALAIAGLAACSDEGRESSRVRVGPETPDDELIVYQSPHGYRSLLFDPAATRYEIHWGGTDDVIHGGEFSYYLRDCSDEFVVCRSDPGGTLIAISRNIGKVASWSDSDLDFTVSRRARGRLPGSHMYFVNITHRRDPSWRRAFIYESGVGVTSITLNYDDERKKSETFTLAGDRGILAEL